MGKPKFLVVKSSKYLDAFNDWVGQIIFKLQGLDPQRPYVLNQIFNSSILGDISYTSKHDGRRQLLLTFYYTNLSGWGSGGKKKTKVRLTIDTTFYKGHYWFEKEKPIVRMEITDDKFSRGLLTAILKSLPLAFADIPSHETTQYTPLR